MRSSDVHTDSSLLSAIASGDKTAFTILFERYRDQLFFYLLKHTKSSEVAEEIVTDIFMKLWTGRELAGQIINIGAFLRKVGYYKILDFLRTTARNSRLQQLYIDHMSPSPEPRADELMISAELKLVLSGAINALPPQRQMIYKLSRQEGLTHDQIATILHLSPNTVSNALSSANSSIKKAVRSYMAQSHNLLLYFLY